MTSLQVTGPIASGTTVNKNISDPRKSRTVVKYLVTEADPSVANLTIAAAITKAVETAALDSAIVTYGSIPLDNLTAKRMGPKKVEVFLHYGNAGTPGQDPGTNEVMSLQLRTAYERVYRRPYATAYAGDTLRYDCDGTAGSGTCADSADCWDASSSSCISPAIKNGLPDGDFIGGLQPNAQPAYASAAYAQWSSWPVAEVAISIPARLSNTSYKTLFDSGKLFSRAGYFNSGNFTWNNIDFAPKSVRIEGATVDWVVEGTTPIYYVQYNLTWRPNGWYLQDLVPKSGSRQKMDTAIINYAEPLVSFTGLFPLS